jgi:hypothetical protein
MINGQLYDWESIEIVLPTGICIGVTSINYKDERPVEPRYGKGGTPRGYGRKNYKADGSMEMDLDEAELLSAALGGSWYGGPPFPIVVCYSKDGAGIVIDELPACKITKCDTSAKQNDESVGGRKFDFQILEPIVWGNAQVVATVAKALL